MSRRLGEERGNGKGERVAAQPPCVESTAPTNRPLRIHLRQIGRPFRDHCGEIGSDWLLRGTLGFSQEPRPGHVSPAAIGNIYIPAEKKMSTHAAPPPPKLVLSRINTNGFGSPARWRRESFRFKIQSGCFPSRVALRAFPDSRVLSPPHHTENFDVIICSSTEGSRCFSAAGNGTKSRNPVKVI